MLHRRGWGTLFCGVQHRQGVGAGGLGPTSPGEGNDFEDGLHWRREPQRLASQDMPERCGTMAAADNELQK